MKATPFFKKGSGVVRVCTPLASWEKRMKENLWFEEYGELPKVMNSLFCAIPLRFWRNISTVLQVLESTNIIPFRT
jgi:hypothetical protein